MSESDNYVLTESGTVPRSTHERIVQKKNAEIARLESENTLLGEALEHIANDGMDARQCMEMARAALAEKEQPK